jgi:hypothetical protein
MMKTPMVLVSIGLLSSTLAGWIGYSAWNSLRGEAEATPVIATVQSQPTLVSPITSSPAVTLAPSTGPETVAAPVTPAAPNPGAPPLSQPANDYLFDLSQALQPSEYQRLNASQQLEMASQIQAWIRAGADFWSLRQQFDAAYRGAIVGDYAHNREVYIRFATERFAPADLASLMVPPGHPYGGSAFDGPYPPPGAEPFLPESADDFSGPPDSMPYPMPYPMPSAPYGYAPYPEAYGLPGPGYPVPNDPGYPNYSEPYPNYPDYPAYPGQPDRPQPPGFQRPQSPQPGSPQSPNIPNLTEVST